VAYKGATSSFHLFSSPELRSFWPAPRIESSGGVRKQEVRESRTSTFLRSLRNLKKLNGSHQLQKWAAIALARYPGPCQRSRSVALAKRTAALGTRTHSIQNGLRRSLSSPLLFRTMSFRGAHVRAFPRVPISELFWRSYHLNANPVEPSSSENNMHGLLTTLHQ